MKILQVLFFTFATTFSIYAQVPKDDLPVPPPAAENEEQERVYTVVEQMPEFEGGNDALMSFISKNMVYPSNAKENEIQGTIFLSYIVRANGNLSDIKVLRSVSGGSDLDREAIRVIKLTNGKWSPGKQNGKPVHVEMKLPFRFLLR
jgi:protein TonB